eukprot:CAMPEP_0172326310 /NCGR_PEP_ID=MMETSP1058-20130122/56173_1 /TAXON_ID=83371 /ORGANISM="Detonula confervacea, Strain CCMP 353" /LENGTH=444 /DNA_ID=CAMNT_0013043063 /DNA_START=112 /DNA_END=1446 /DNA_ORIENTATION=-
MTTPVEEVDTEDMNKGPFPLTPSPQAVDELFESTAVTSANRSAVVSRMLSDYLVTVNDDEVIVSSTTVTLPELEEATAHYNYDDHADDDMNATKESPVNSPLITTPRHIPPILIQHKMLYQSISSFASPIRAEDFMPQLHVGPEREVVFHTESLGIKISRHTDGYVRVLSVTPYRAMGSEKVRDGDIYNGDVVREVSDVNLRMPIDSAVWKLTIGLIKMAPRPLRFVVARELQVSEEEEVGAAEHDGNTVQANNNPTSESSMSNSMQQSSCNTKDNQKDDSRFGTTREIHFLESCLGVKLHHTSEGFVQILSVAPYKSFPNSPLARTGDINAGDVVLEVGGVWDLRKSIDATSWGALIKFIRETRRPLCMVVADADSLQTVSEEEEEDQREVPSHVNSADRQDQKERNGSEELDITTSNSSQQSPDICKALDEQLLQKELEKDS